MHPDASTLWRGPRWALPLLLACLSTVGPFAIDTYLPAFTGIAQSLQTTPVHMQQTLSAYLVGFAVMNLFHGALADSFGRRPVILCGMLAFMVSSAGCAMAESIGTLVAWRTVQGIASGAGMVVSRAVIRDMFAPEQAQRVMSQVTIYFGIAPAIAPIIGGWLFVHAGWRSVFWLLTGIGALLALELWGLDLSVVGLIGIILLMGIVKKNGIMVIDFALEAQRERGMSPHDAVVEACLLRFRPIMMTTAAALLGALPLVLSSGIGAELRLPLGVSIVGGLLLSQLITLFTTPAVYLAMERLRAMVERWRGAGGTSPAPAE